MLNSSIESILGENADLIDILQYRALHQPEKTAFIFLKERKDEEERLTYKALDRKARSIAFRLRSTGMAGGRALLLYPPGLEYIAAFFGCLYAGVIAVPVYPPHPAKPERTMPRLRGITKSAQPFAALSTTSIQAMMELSFAEDKRVGSMGLIATDDIPDDGDPEWRKPEIGGESIAFLQYTSGSTGSPKGVMVSHGNLMHNEKIMQMAFEVDENDVTVGWLPLYHDMGLIGNVLQSVYVGMKCVLMSPTAFLQKPFRWLEAISQYRASVSGGPNFAYDLCALKIPPEQRTELDLSCWEAAFNGSEPIRPETLNRFSDAFEVSGFRKSAFFPCYGLAEGTLIVSGCEKKSEPEFGHFDKDALNRNLAVLASKADENAVVLAGSGKTLDDQRVSIVNPDTMESRRPGEIGEVWVSGRSVAAGYWNQPETTKQTFHAYLSDKGDGPYLRTGDLGFFSEGELFITGRLKDLIIIRGRNYYPQDIELTATQSYPRLRPGCSAAFQVEVNGEDRLVVVSEVERRFVERRRKKDASGYEEDRRWADRRLVKELPEYVPEDKTPLRVEKASEAIRGAVAKEHELEVYAVVLIKVGSLPKTSSGKIQRYICKSKFLDNTLDAVGTSIPEKTDDVEISGFPDKETLLGMPLKDRRELTESYLQNLISIAFRNVLDGKKVGIHDNFFDLGGDSLLLIRMQNKIKEVLRKDIQITDLFKYPSVSSLAGFLAQGDEERPYDFQEIRERVKQQKRALSRHEPIAVIGMAGRFPGAGNTDEFWDNLRNGVDSVATFTDEEMKASGADPLLMNNPNYVRKGTVLDDIEMFDAAFFGVSPGEAAYMDPQHRLFMECAWETFENAGYDPEGFKGRVGVYAGSFFNFYLIKNLLPVPEFISDDEHNVILNDKDYLSTRISYILNLKGPSVSLSTACSTSLIAIHLACQGLLTHQCDMALAGGVSVLSSQKQGYLYKEGGMRSPDGRCRAFDANAKGTLFGSGMGAVLLKRLDDARADGDHVYAVIKGSAANNDGSIKAGYTAPGVNGQSEVIAEAQAVAEVEPETVTYVETHGTGTSIGDPIEIRALTEAFRAGTQKKGFCAIGSVKTNVGHLNMAAGVTGFIKTVLAIQHKAIPSSLHFERPNPAIDFAGTPFYVNTRLAEWRTDQGVPRRAGVSAFGVGGTNAHVVLEEAPDQNRVGEVETGERDAETLKSDDACFMPPRLILLSAKTDSALDAASANLADYLRRGPDVALADVAYTLQVGRKAFSRRRAVVCHSVEDAAQALETLDPGRLFTTACEPGDRPVAFMFPGQGAQYADMGLELYRNEPVFRGQIDVCSEHINPHLGFDLRHVLYPSNKWGVKKHRDSLPDINQTDVAQAALFITEYALARLWMEWGIRPQAMIGHSIGEYVAACIAGVFSLEDALMLVAERGRMMRRQPRGDMLVVPLPEAEVASLLNEPDAKGLCLAAVNGPAFCVVSGQTPDVETLKSRLKGRGVECRVLHTSHAFHSEMMDPVVGPFTERVGQVDLMSPAIPFLSNVTGTWMTDEDARDPAYWARHLRGTVRFAGGMQELLDKPEQILLEAGPGRTLGTFAMQQANKKAEQPVLASMRHPRDAHSDTAFLLTTLGRLWCAGAKPDWVSFHTPEPRRRLPLPTYPFDRRRYWVDLPASDAGQIPTSTAGDRKSDVADWFYLPSWERAPFPFSSQAGDASGRWLLFVDECGIGSYLANQLAGPGRFVATVEPGAAFAKTDDNRYMLNPGKPEDYDALVDELLGRDGAPENVVHLWTVTSPDNDAQTVDDHLNNGFYSLLYFVQALERKNCTEELRIAAVSNDMQDVTGEESLCPAKSALLGPATVIPHEYPNIRCISMDVVVPEKGTRKFETLSDHLVSELNADLSDAVVAYRGNYRWRRTVKPIRLERESKQAGTGLREKGVYLITGGLGGIGLALAEYLAKTVRARLVLTGRSSLPDREKWEEWLASHEEQDRISRKILKIKELEALGAEIAPMKADVADAEQMRDVVRRAEARFGGINGVIHAAGLPGDGTIGSKAPAEFEKVLAPKIKGTIILDALVETIQPDFFVLFSSISSLLGGFGLADYAAGNAFLDAFARRKASESNVFTVGIDWDNWREVGMAADVDWDMWKAVGKAFDKDALPRLREMRRRSLEKEGIPPGEGVEAFRRILDNRLPQVLVSPLDFEVRRRKTFTLDSLASFPVQEIKSVHPRPNLGNPYVPPRSDTEQVLAELFQKLLGIGQVGVYDNFFELGGHSLMATQLASRLRDAFHVELPLNTLYENPNVSGISTHIDQLQNAGKTDASAVDAEYREEGEI